MSTDTFECRVTVARDGKVIRRAALETCVEPLASEVYALPVPEEVVAGEYTVTVSFHTKEDQIWAQRGHEVAFGQYVYSVEDASCACAGACCKSLAKAGRKGVTVIQSTHNIGVRGEHFEVMFSVLSGGLVSYRYAGREMMEAVPKPNFWRAPVDNDCGNQMQGRYAQWKIASMYITHKAMGEELFAPCRPEVKVNSDSAEVVFTYNLCTIPAAQCRVIYILAIFHCA